MLKLGAFFTFLVLSLGGLTRADSAPNGCAFMGMDADSILTGALLFDSFGDNDTNRSGCVLWALQNGANPNGSGDPGLVPLILALENGESDLAQLLLSHGANPNLPDDKGLTPLDRAAFAMDDASIDALLKANANVNTGDLSHVTPLIAAVMKADAHAVRALLDHGANLNAKLQLGSEADPETALDFSNDDLSTLQSIQDELEAANAPKPTPSPTLSMDPSLSDDSTEDSLIVNHYVEEACEDHSGTLNTLTNKRPPLRSLNEIIQSQKQIGDWLKAAGGM